MPCNRAIEILPTAADLFHAAAEEFMRVGKEAIAVRNRFTVGLSGGSTPRSLYSLLAEKHADFDWHHTFLFFGDERHVPPADHDSNYRMVNEALLSKISIPASNVFRVSAENPDAAAAAADYETQLRSFFDLEPGEFPRFDVILLGMGPDGHTASLFPGSEGLKEQSRLVIANWVEKFKTYRITFTFPVLNHAAEIIFLASSPDKAAMVHQVLEGKNNPPYPAQQVQPTDGKLLWLLDEPAAKQLSWLERARASKWLPNLGLGGTVVAAFVTSYFAAIAAMALTIIIGFGSHAYFDQGLRVINWKHGILSTGEKLPPLKTLLLGVLSMLCWVAFLYITEWIAGLFRRFLDHRSRWLTTAFRFAGAVALLSFAFGLYRLRGFPAVHPVPIAALIAGAVLLKKAITGVFQTQP